MPLPDNGPINLLALDGGGVRGVSELVILHKIMEGIQEKEQLAELPKPCDYFHIIGGTSTGGLVAIMLGRLRMSTAEALAEYDAFAKKIFSFRNRRISVSAQFRAAALEVAVRNIVESRGADPLMRDPKENYPTGKTFVCAVTAKNQTAPRRFRGYVLDGELDLDFGRDYDKDWDKDCKIWEAARATTAAPGFFKPVAIVSGSVTEKFLDAAMGYNNPIGEVLDEAGKIIDSSCKIGCVLSLGTGTREKGLNEPSCCIPWCFSVCNLMKNITTDSERMHDMAKNRFTDFSSTYFRFSVPEAAANVKLGKYKKMDGLKKTTLEYLGSSVKSDIDKVIDVLSNGSTEGLTIGEACCPQSQVPRREAGVSSKFFTGRTDILRKMSAFFVKRESGKGPRREFLLHGMGGVGKTQIALKFRQMMDSEDMFENIFWVDATSSVTIEESYNNIATKLLADEAGNDKKMLHVLKWMDASREEWMLVMDNCGDEDLTRFLPEKDKGNIIYTSRFTNMRQALPPNAIAEVNEMEERDAVTLLLRAAGEGANSRSAGFRRLGLPIVQELGCLPLAIDQAGAYVREAWPPCTLRDYLGRFRKERTRMLKDGGGQYQGASRQNQAVYATFEMSHKALQDIAKGKKGLAMAEAARMAIKILSAICFYHNEGILEEMMERAAENRHEAHLRTFNPLQSGRLNLEDLLDVDQNEMWDPRKFQSGASLLESLSLVKRDWNSLSMHVLVHSWARDRMKDADRAIFSK
ncbi:acyl transferase/acyl hydrolase/lysophospholipase [Cercophora scortea]|uniref:Acyl transferase/acyl hydrolase/lysophospholipase n=1 Tax=Cercophora scortea TaxID=314031 RepID=A0AAE0J5G3_9PEZI|nr:acyl transferase/acyl hydrolase/lysophospholipase [Cercophora scortea]